MHSAELSESYGNARAPPPLCITMVSAYLRVCRALHTRKSYDGLQALARHAMGRDPLDGALYVFVNRRGSQIKCLYFDRSGFCIWGKRLESGKFISDWRTVRTREMDWTGLKLLLEGLEGKRVRKRFSLPSVVTKGL
jgi:transposase